MMKSTASMVGIAVLAACAPQPEPRDSVPVTAEMPVEDAEVRGILRVVGSAPVNTQLVLQVEGRGPIRLSGPLTGELERLAGVEVTVTGRIGPSPDPMAEQELEATGYEIGLVNGRGVIVGEVVQVTPEGALLRRADGSEVYLRAVPSEFEPGQKVWVQGPETVIVQTYGVLRP